VTVDVAIRAERAADIAAIRSLVQTAFAGPAEAGLVDALRQDGDLLASLVGEADGEIIGHVAFSRLPIATVAGQVHVAPYWRGRGIGAALVRAGLEACARLGVQASVVLGQPAYYRRFGFSADAAREIRSPYSGPAFMALELQPTVPLRGDARYAAAFASLD
jgi:putative acetyltransferase